MDIPTEFKDMIGKEIESSTNPTGIDPKWTHIIVIYKLMQIEQRLNEIDQRIKTGTVE